MGMESTSEGMPDVYGLPHYVITEVIVEIDGPDVRMACGVKVFGTIHWLYTVTMRADRLITTTRNLDHAAHEAFNLSELLGVSGRGH